MINICAQNDFAGCPKDGDFRIISSVKLNDEYQVPVKVAKNKLAPMAYSYAELYHIYDVWKAKQKKDEWIGFCHVNRYFDFVDKEHNVTTLPTPLVFNMHDQYAECHNINDLLECEKIIDEIFPEYHCEYASIEKLYPKSMFVLKKDDFDAYCKFVFGVLDKFNEKNGLKTDADVNAYVTKNEKDYNKSRAFNAALQSHLHGFLAERIGTIFFLNYFKDSDVRELPVKKKID